MARPIPARAADLPASRNDAAGIVRGPRPVRYLAGFVAVVGVAAYFVALHTLIVTRAMPTLTLMLILAPWGGAIGSLTAAKLGRTSSPSMRVLAVLGGVAVLVAVVVATFHFAWHEPAKADVVLYVENLAFFGWLSSLFGASLFGGGEALVTRMARRVRRGDMPPPVVLYTRRLTAAWSAFFVAVMALSTLLFIGASREVWSLFVNLLIWPLVGAAFVVEYAVRSIVLRDVAHVPFLAAFRAFHDLDRTGGAKDHR